MYTGLLNARLCPFMLKITVVNKLVVVPLLSRVTLTEHIDLSLATICGYCYMPPLLHHHNPRQCASHHLARHYLHS